MGYTGRMKYPYVALACAMLFGAGCSLPFASAPATQRMSARPVPIGPPPAAPMAAPEMTTYTDPEFGVQVAYPTMSAALATSDIDVSAFAAPGVSRQLFSITDPSSARISSPLVLSVWNGKGEEADCYATSTQRGPLTESVVINGVTFRTGYWNEGAAGGLWEGPIYRTFMDGVCFDFEYTIETHSDGSPEFEKMRTETERRIAQFFDPIIKSIKFVK